MRSSASLLLLVAAGTQAQTPARPPLPPEVQGASGPTGTAGTGTQGYDRVGYATWHGEPEGEAEPDAIAAAHPTLPIGSIAEVTALDTGRTILVRIAARGPADPRFEIDLSRGAAGLLGIADEAAAVRVRPVAASAADASALARGEAASPRIDAPPALLAALRRQLPSPPRREPRRSPPVASPRAAKVAPVPVAAGRFVVQVAAFSAQGRAQAVAKALGGAVQPAGALWRVRLGPYRDLAGAQRARDAAIRRGYADARILPGS